MPWLIAMKGFPGTGKSAVARALSRELGWPLIDKDDIKDVLDERMPAAGGPSYDVMLRIVRRQLLQGVNVICDSPLPRQTYDNIRMIASETGAKLVVIECHCSDQATWRARVEARQELGLPSHQATTWDDIDAFHERHAGTTYEVLEPHLVLDSMIPLPELMAHAVAWIGQTTQLRAGADVTTQTW